MSPLWVTAPSLGALGLAGLLLDRALGLRLDRAGVARWALRALAGLVAAFLVVLHPTAAALVAAVALVARGRSAGPATRAPSAGERWLFVATAVVAVMVAARPATPLYWDEFVWLGKARIEARAFGSLRTAALDPAAGVLPPGYPLFWPLAVAWLGATARDTRALVAGAGALTLVTAATFLGAAHAALFAGRTRREVAGAALGLATLAATPLVAVHARAAYVDLPLGLLAATATLSFVARATETETRAPRWPAAAAALAAIAAAGAKDEGLAHFAGVALAAGAWAAWTRSRGRARDAAVTVACAVVPFAVWRGLLARHHVADADHALGAPALGAAGALGRELLRHATDVRTWGATWPAVLGALVAVATRPRAFAPATRFAALALLGQAAALAAGVLCGPARVREFALAGTLLNRLLMQLLPAGAVLLALCARAACAPLAPAQAPATPG